MEGQFLRLLTQCAWNHRKIIGHLKEFWGIEIITSVNITIVFLISKIHTMVDHVLTEDRLFLVLGRAFLFL